jgi:hypothetical protein
VNGPFRAALVIYFPVLAAYILPALFLLPVGVTFTLLAIFDPTLPLSSAAAYDLWIIGPLAAAVVVLLIGRLLVSFYQRGNSSRISFVAIWGTFTAALFTALWFGVVILTSIGASETPPSIFLRMTALGAASLTLAAQVFVIPWLLFTCRRFLPMNKEFSHAN